MAAATGWIGLGAMGMPMAKNLAESLEHKPLIVYNRSTDKAASLAAAAAPGAVKVAANISEIAASCQIVHLMLSDDAACDTVLAQLLSPAEAAGSGGGGGRAMAPGGVVINHSTVHPDCSKRSAARAAAAGVEYVACPVFGRPDAAAARRLLVVPAGAPAALKRVEGQLAALGRVLAPVGDDAHKANVLKLTGNFMIASVIEMIGEALALAEKHGVGGSSVLEFIEAFFPAPPIVGYARRIAGNDLDAGTGFTVDLALKDVRYMRQLAEEARAPLPLADLAFNHLLTAAAIGHGRSDWGAIALAARAAAGLPVPPPGGAAAGGEGGAGGSAGKEGGPKQ